MTSNRQYLNHYLQFLLGSLIVFFLAYCFHFNAELSDEGFYLYYFQQGYKAVSFNFYHILVSPIGRLFSHYLIGYRYLSLVFLIASSLSLYFSMPIDKRRNNWLLPLSLGLMYFNLLSTFSYNTVVLGGAALALSLMIRIQGSHYKKSIASMIGLLCLFIFSARFGSGVIILILSSLSYVLLVENKKEALKCVLFSWGIFLLSLGIYLFFFKDNFLLMLETLPAITQSSHVGLLNKYIEHTTRFIFRSTLPPLLLGMILLKFLPTKFKTVLTVYLGYFVFKNILYDFNFAKFFYYASGLILAVSIIELYSQYKTHMLTKERAFFTLFPLALFFSSSLGTNNNLFESTSFNCLLLYPLIYNFDISLKKFQVLSGLVFLFSLFGIYQNQYFQTYRSLPRSEQMFVNSKFQSLKGIMVNQNTELKLEKFDSLLVRSGFTKLKDQVVAYPNLPGLVSFLGLKAYGNPWNIDIYTNSFIYNCIFYKFEHRPVHGRLFLYAEKAFPDEMVECLNRPYISLSIN